EAIYAADLRADAALVRASALVLHRRDDRAIPYAAGRELAASLEGSRFVSLDGNVHLAWLGDSAAVLAAVDAFLERHDPAAPPPARDAPPPATGAAPP